MTTSIGIVDIEYQLLSYYMDQETIAKNINCPLEKLTIGLGLKQISVPSQREDVVSLAMSAVRRLMSKCKILPDQVGRLEVGTEGNHDAAKSVKTYLMDLFPGNSSICGCDTTNACYGGTSALLNSISWMQSMFWDGRYAIVVCTDISSYKDNAARPTSGGGAVAILLGPNCVYAIRPEIAHYFSNELDFTKPRETFPFPILDGKRSIEVYVHAFNSCYDQMIEKMSTQDFYDKIVCHAPYPKLVTKVCTSRGINKDKYQESLLASQRNGNSYTASLYFSLISLLSRQVPRIGERFCLFSFGSGCASSMFVIERVREGCEIKDFLSRLNRRKVIDYESYERQLHMNLPKNTEEVVGQVSFDGFYLSRIINYGRYYSLATENKE